MRKIKINPSSKIQSLLTKFILMTGLSLFSIQSHAILISAYDAEGNANDSAGINSGTLINGTGFTNGQTGQAFDFDGINDAIRVSDNSTLDFSSAITLAAWVRPESEGSSGGVTGILWKGNSVGTQSGQSYAFLFQGSNLLFRLSDGSTLYQSPDFSLSLNTFTHIAATYDGSIMNLYINGLLESSSTYAPAYITNSSGDLLIGSSTLSPTSFVGDPSQFFFDGQIDDVRLYNNALTSSEIQSLAAVPVPASIWLFVSGMLGLLAIRRRASNVPA